MEVRMSDDARRSDRGAEYVLFVSIIFCVACAFFMMDYVPDDSYISFRYARNLAEGHGLRFNPTETPVEGYSNLLWILLCAFLYKLGFDLPETIPTIGIVLSVMNVTLLWALYRRRRLPSLQMLLPLVVLAGSGPAVMYAVSGMEMPLYALLLLATVYALDLVLSDGRIRDYALLTAASVLLSLCRPEGTAALPVAAVVILWMRRKNGEAPGRVSNRGLAVSLALFSVCLLAYHIWRVRYFGEWLPTPLLSKGGAGVSLVTAWLMNLKFYFVKHMYYTPPVGYYYGALFMLAVVGLLFSRSAPALKRTETIALVLAGLYALFYFNFKDWMPGMRYHSPYVALLLLPAVHVQTPFFTEKRTAKQKAAFWLVGLAVLAINLGVLAELRIIAHIAEEGNRQCNMQLGKWLKKNVPAEALLAVSDVGAIPYYSELRTLDINPQSLTDLYIAKHGFSIDYVAERRPEVIIIPSRSFVAAKFYTEHFEMASDLRFDDWRLIGVSRVDWFEDRCYWVYVEKSFPLLSDEQMATFPHGVGSVSRTYR
jgi:arabinofuranosyltransferase